MQVSLLWTDNPQRVGYIVTSLGALHFPREGFAVIAEESRERDSALVFSEDTITLRPNQLLSNEIGSLQSGGSIPPIEVIGLGFTSAGDITLTLDTWFLY